MESVPDILKLDQNETPTTPSDAFGHLLLTTDPDTSRGLNTFKIIILVVMAVILLILVIKICAKGCKPEFEPIRDQRLMSLPGCHTPIVPVLGTGMDLTAIRAEVASNGEARLMLDIPPPYSAVTGQPSSELSSFKEKFGFNYQKLETPPPKYGSIGPLK